MSCGGTCYTTAEACEACEAREACEACEAGCTGGCGVILSTLSDIHVYYLKVVYVECWEDTIPASQKCLIGKASMWLLGCSP